MQLGVHPTGEKTRSASGRLSARDNENKNTFLGVCKIRSPLMKSITVSITYALTISITYAHMCLNKNIHRQSFHSTSMEKALSMTVF